MAFPTSPANGDIYNNYVFIETNSLWDKLDPNKAFPIGFIYTQLPGKSTPDTLGWYGTWTNVSSTFAGEFFRAEGGSAGAFEAGQQTDQMQGHLHVILGTSAAGSSPGAGNPTTAMYGKHNTTVDGSTYISDSIAADTDGTPRTGAETRPINETVRVWERTA